MGGGRKPGFAHDPADGGVSPLPRRSARAIGDGDEAGLQRLKRLERLPERFLHRLSLWREELERDRHIAGKIGVKRRCNANILSFGSSAVDRKSKRLKSR